MWNFYTADTKYGRVRIPYPAYRENDPLLEADMKAAVEEWIADQRVNAILEDLNIKPNTHKPC
jgi:hypothetical protein